MARYADGDIPETDDELYAELDRRQGKHEQVCRECGRTFVTTNKVRCSTCARASQDLADAKLEARMETLEVEPDGERHTYSRETGERHDERAGERFESTGELFARFALAKGATYRVETATSAGPFVGRLTGSERISPMPRDPMLIFELDHPLRLRKVSLSSISTIQLQRADGTADVWCSKCELASSVVVKGEAYCRTHDPRREKISQLIGQAEALLADDAFGLAGLKLNEAANAVHWLGADLAKAIDAWRRGPQHAAIADVAHAAELGFEHAYVHPGSQDCRTYAECHARAYGPDAPAGAGESVEASRG